MPTFEFHSSFTKPKPIFSVPKLNPSSLKISGISTALNTYIETPVSQGFAITSWALGTRRYGSSSWASVLLNAKRVVWIARRRGNERMRSILLWCGNVLRRFRHSVWPLGVKIGSGIWNRCCHGISIWSIYGERSKTNLDIVLGLGVSRNIKSWWHFADDESL